MKPVRFQIVRFFSRLLLAAALTAPGMLAADESVPAAPAPVAVAASQNLMNIAVYDALLSAGAGEPEARAAARSVAATDHLATKSDLAKLQAKVEADFAKLRSDFILTGATVAGAVMLTMLAGFHMLWRRISELAERLPRTAGAH